MFAARAIASHRTRGNLALMFGEYLERWKLTPDGEPIATPTSRLLPVRWRGSPAMLKIARLSGRRGSAAY
jgi:streptomycin 6-kinase